MTLLQAIILAIIEGITEYLPVSSTGHLIIGSAVMGIEKHDFVKLFSVAIQFGAILSVVVLYWKRFFQSVDFYLKLFVAFVPAVVAGLLFKEHIEAMLENVVIVAVALLVGGIIFLFIDRWTAGRQDAEERPVSYQSAFMIGLFQCLAMVPGVSRSASTIIGGMTQGLSRKRAAEFSFFLAVPTMFGATVKTIYDYTKDGGVFTSEHIKLFAIGNLVAFVVAMIAIRTFIALLTRHGFAVFGWYRIALGGVILVLYALHVPLNMM
ncbi:MAG: undecaprenyl-diphosphate phosphatase [Flavobacteriales bacterium]